MNLAPARALIPDTDTDFTTKYICAVKYQTLEILWHAAINVPSAWLVMTRRVTGVRNMTLSDTPRFPTRRALICDSSGIVKYHGSKNSTKLFISRSARGKTYSSFANHGKLGKPRHFVTLRTVYYLLSDKFFVFSVLDLQQNNSISLILQIWFKTKIKQHILSRLICIKWYFDNIKCLSSVYFN